jgi:hypothetical protein
MVTFEAQWVDVTRFILERHQPVAIVKREPIHTGPRAWAGGSQVGSTSEFWVPITSLLEPDVKFSHTVIGDAVRVPMHAYHTQYRLLPSIFALGIQIGMATIIEMAKHTGYEAKHVKLVLGQECTDLSPTEEAYRCYIGIAVQVK